MKGCSHSLAPALKPTKAMRGQRELKPAGNTAHISPASLTVCVCVCVSQKKLAGYVVAGDRDKVKENCTTNRAAYHPPPLETTPPGHAYSRAAAVSSILHSSVHLGACPSLSQPPPTALLPTSWGPGERVREREHRNKSFLPEGDMDRERVRSRMKHSTSLSSHKPVSSSVHPFSN